MPFLSGHPRRIPIAYGTVKPGSNLTDFPLLVKITGNRWLGYAHFDENGFVNRFRITAADGTTEIPFEIKNEVAVGTHFGDQHGITDVDTGANTLTSAAHGLENGMAVSVISSGTVPAPLALSTIYFIVNKTTDTFQLAATRGGAAIDLTSAGTGNHFWTAGSYSANYYLKLNPASGASTGDVLAYLYYGNAGGTSGENVSNTWNSAFKAVYHLEEDPTGGSGAILDSTSNNQHGTAAGSMTSGDLVAASVGNGLDFDATDDVINCGAIAAFHSATNVTLEGIVSRTSASTAVGSGLANSSSGGPTNRCSYLWYLDDTLYCHAENGAASYGFCALSGTGAHHIALLYDGGGSTDADRLKVLIDGVPQTLSFNTAIPASLASDAGGAFTIGKDSSDRFSGGVQDEVRLSNVTRSLAWATYASANLLTNSSTVTLGAEEIDPGAPTLGRPLRRAMDLYQPLLSM